MNAPPEDSLPTRIAREQEALAALAAGLEQLLADHPACLSALGREGRVALQRLDYLCQAMHCLADVLRETATPGPPDPARLEGVIAGLPLADMALRLRGPPEARNGLDAGDDVEVFGMAMDDACKPP